MNIMRKLGRLAALSACLGTAVACDDFLSVDQTVEPASRTIFDSDLDFQAAVGSSFGVWWGTAQGSRPTNSVQNWPVLAMSGLADELVQTLTTTTGHSYVVQEPRVAYDNDQFGGNWLFRKPFYDMYQCTATAVDAIRYLNQNPTRIVYELDDDDNLIDRTARIRWFSRLMNGLCHMYAGLLFDQGYTIDESFDTQNPNQDYAAMLKPHWEVTAHGIAQLEMAIAEMEADPTNPAIPATWINRDETNLVTKAELIRFAHSMIARGLIYDARTPQQRADADWDRAVSHIDDGITADFWVRGSTPRFDSRYKQYINFTNDGRIHYRIMGPADTSGRYQDWEAQGLAADTFVVKTPDRRVHGTGSATVADWRSAGRYFFLRQSNCNPASINCWVPSVTSASGGTYRRSMYASNKWGGSTHYNTGQLVTLSVKEMNFLRAEALLRAGDPDGAVALINAQGRTNATTGGALPAATVDGAPGTPQSCVPKKLMHFGTIVTDTEGEPVIDPATNRPKREGVCGDLWDVLMYEKRMETHGTEAIIPFADWRGWGMMPFGTICHFAPPGRELELIGVPYYSFGGEWAGSVGQPQRENQTTCGTAYAGPLGAGLVRQ